MNKSSISPLPCLSIPTFYLNIEKLGFDWIPSFYVIRESYIGIQGNIYASITGLEGSFSILEPYEQYGSLDDSIDGDKNTFMDMLWMPTSPCAPGSQLEYLLAFYISPGSYFGNQFHLFNIAQSEIGDAFLESIFCLQRERHNPSLNALSDIWLSLREVFIKKFDAYFPN